MSDPTNDIAALNLALENLRQPEHWRSILTSLLAERNALKQRVAQFEAADTISAQRVSDLIADKLRLQQRVAELEAALKPSDRDLRERLVCAALTGVMAHPSTVGNPKDLAEIAVAHADAAIAAMRKGDSDAQ